MLPVAVRRRATPVKVGDGPGPTFEREEERQIPPWQRLEQIKFHKTDDPHGTARSTGQRINFGRLEEAIETPNLIEVQLNSYKDFLQKEVAPNKRKNEGLQAVFSEVFPIESYDEKIKLEFGEYEIGEPKLSPLECQRESQTFAAPLYVTFRLREDKNVKEERVYMGELPLMAPQGTFIINGAERVVVSQLHRSPGICFESSLHANGKVLYSYRIIPDRGSWLEVMYDTSDLLYVHLDRRKRRRKFLVTTFLRALGYSTRRGNHQAFLHHRRSEAEARSRRRDDRHQGAHRRNPRHGQRRRRGRARLRAADPGGHPPAARSQIKTVKVIDIKDDDTIIKCLKKDPTHDTEEALKDIYRRLRPGDPPTVTNAKALLKRLFFDPKRYDIGRVGRYKINQKLSIDVDLETRIITNEDIVAATQYVINLRRGEGSTDDIDHLGSRRVRTVGELLANQCRTGLSRTERLVKERMTLFDVNTEGMTPQKLINPKALSAVIRDFFGRSQLSQFMDQTNPLAELTHKRRLSALGPGGLSRDRAGFEVRDVHPSHYGRICPIETPEGPNIGLISSMSCFSRINEFGFIETPYRKVINGKVTDQVDYLTADQEENYIVAQANAPHDSHGKFTEPKISVRYKGDFLEVEPDRVSYMDVSLKQLVSVAASLIPFLEHDDANRALMGSNMQRQGVPLIKTEAPLVGTGMEGKVARDSRRSSSRKAPARSPRSPATSSSSPPTAKCPKARRSSSTIRKRASTFTSCASTCARTPAPA